MSSPHAGRPRAKSLATALVALAALLIALTGWSAPSASAATTTYQAESAALSGGAVVGTDHTGYTGSGFVGGYTDTDKGTAATTFTVTASAAGAHTSALRYANGTGATMTLSVYVNGTKATQVSARRHRRLEHLDDRRHHGHPHVGQQHRRLQVRHHRQRQRQPRRHRRDSGRLHRPAGQYEAESAALSGGAVVGTDHTGYTGSGFVGGYTDATKGTAATTFTRDHHRRGQRTGRAALRQRDRRRDDAVGLRQRHQGAPDLAAGHRRLEHLGRPRART